MKHTNFKVPGLKAANGRGDLPNLGEIPDLLDMRLLRVLIKRSRKMAARGVPWCGLKAAIICQELGMIYTRGNATAISHELVSLEKRGLARREATSRAARWFPTSKAITLDGFGEWAQVTLEEYNITHKEGCVSTPLRT